MLSANNLHQILIAIHEYEETHGHLPPAAICDEDGRPLLSWRVLLLPYLEEEPLFKEFHLDEAWDSPRNLKLLQRMPRDYAPLGQGDFEPYCTFYQAIVGPGAAFEPGRSLKLKEDFGDGAANTLMIVEAAEAVPWTRPADVVYDLNRPIPPLGGMFKGRTHWFDEPMRIAGINVAFADGSTWFFAGGQIGEDQWRALITRNGGEKTHHLRD